MYKSLEYYEKGPNYQRVRSLELFGGFYGCGFEREAGEILHDIFSEKEKTIKFVKTFQKRLNSKILCYEEKDDEELLLQKG